jgi:hypothetical protein
MTERLTGDVDPALAASLGGHLEYLLAAIVDERRLDRPVERGPEPGIVDEIGERRALGGLERQGADVGGRLERPGRRLKEGESEVRGRKRVVVQRVRGVVRTIR